PRDKKGPASLPVLVLVTPGGKLKMVRSLPSGGRFLARVTAQGRKFLCTRNITLTTSWSSSAYGPAGRAPFSASVAAPLYAVLRWVHNTSTPMSRSGCGFHCAREPTCHQLKSGEQLLVAAATVIGGWTAPATGTPQGVVPAAPGKCELMIAVAVEL